VVKIYTFFVFDDKKSNAKYLEILNPKNINNCFHQKRYINKLINK